MADKSLRFLLFGEDRGAGKTFGKAAGDADSASQRMGAAFHKLGGAVGGEFGDIVSKVGDAFSGLEGKQASLGAKLMGAGGAAAGVGTALAFISSADKQATDQLKAAVEASGHSWDEYEAQFDGVIKKQEDYGHSAVDTQGALQKMTQALGDPAKAIANMGLVANLAAARHISLSDAATLVDKVIGGKGAKTLAEYGIVMGKSKDRTHDAQVALEALSKKVDGQASASVDNFGAKVGIVQTKLGDWVAQMGQTVGPALQAGGVAVLALGTIIESGMGKAVISGIASVGRFALSMGAMAVEAGVAFGAMVVEALAWAGSMLVAGATAMLPFLPIIAIVAVVGAAAYLLYRNWDKVWSWITHTTSVAGDKVRGFLGSIVDFAKRIPGWLGSAFSGIVGILTLPYRTAFNLIADLWNATLGKFSFTIPSWVPVIGGNTYSLPQMPHLASGGRLQRGGSVLVGEYGPEVVQLDAGAQVVPLNRAGSGAGAQVTIVVQGDTDPHAAARRIYKLLTDGHGDGALRLVWPS